MSARIGEVKAGARLLGRVSASRGGVELHVEAGSLDPLEARNLAALLVRGAEETERMRRIDPEASRDERAGYAMGRRDALAVCMLVGADAEADLREKLTIKGIAEAIDRLEYERSLALGPEERR